MRIPLVARTDLDHEGFVVPAGTRFEATPIEAAILRYQRKADFAPPGRTDPAPIDLTLDKSDISRIVDNEIRPAIATVLRENTNPGPPALAVTVALEPDTPKRKRGRPRKPVDPDAPATPRRTYRRRDLTAEPTS